MVGKASAVSLILAGMWVPYILTEREVRSSQEEGPGYMSLSSDSLPSSRSYLLKLSVSSETAPTADRSGVQNCEPVGTIHI